MLAVFNAARIGNLAGSRRTQFRCWLLLCSCPSHWIKYPVLSLLYRIFREDRLGPLERLVDRLLWRHGVVHHIKLGDTEEMLAVHLGDRRIVHLVDRHLRAQYGQLRVCPTMRILYEPERIAFDDFRDRQHKSAEPALKPLVQYLWLNRVFQKLLGGGDVFRAAWDDRAIGDDLRRQRLAVIAERQAAGFDGIVILFLVVNR